MQSIGDACWNAPFWNAPGKVIRPYFLLIIQRSSRPLQISAAGFEDVSLQTFADVSTYLTTYERMCLLEFPINHTYTSKAAQTRYYLSNIF